MQAVAAARDAPEVELRLARPERLEAYDSITQEYDAMVNAVRTWLETRGNATDDFNDGWLKAYNQGDGVIFAVHHRPVRGARGFYRVNLRHGVSRLHSGRRLTLGIIFHDAQ